MSNLSDRWIKAEISRQKRLVGDLFESHEALVDKTTPYAQGMMRMIRVRGEIISHLNEEIESYALAMSGKLPA